MNSKQIYFLGNTKDYKKFIRDRAAECLKPFDKLLFFATKWNPVLWKAAYSLYLKDVIIAKLVTVTVKDQILKSLDYVEIYGNRYYYDNMQERLKFRKWVKGKVRQEI